MSTRGPQSDSRRGERAALVGVIKRASAYDPPESALDELAGLADAAGAAVVFRAVQERASPDPATYIGKGKAESIKLGCEETGANLVIVDNELTPAQTRNLETIIGCRVIDRTELVLDIFAKRARTREGKLQVELAQLQYSLPRLKGKGIELSGQGGGIGTRGPGETKLETDRRRVRMRLAALKRDIADVQRRRGNLRARRRRTEVPTVALVGYTNAGKSTLFNLLTGGEAVASDALFVTLDPLIRRVRLPDSRQVMIADTVGFLDRLPHELVAAFHATLEEVVSADLLLHVIDASAPDLERRAGAVRAVLAEVGAATVPILEIFNKIDRLSDEDLARLKAQHGAGIFISAREGSGRDDLIGVVVAHVSMDVERVSLTLDASSADNNRILADLYRHARVINHVAHGGLITIEADVPRRLAARFAGVGVGS